MVFSLLQTGGKAKSSQKRHKGERDGSLRRASSMLSSSLLPLSSSARSVHADRGARCSLFVLPSASAPVAPLAPPLMSSSNGLLLSYESVSVYEHDVRTLRPGAWLNDNIVAFAMDYLQHEHFAAHAHRWRFVSPTTTLILTHEEGQTTTTLNERLFDFRRLCFNSSLDSRALTIQ